MRYLYLLFLFPLIAWGEIPTSYYAPLNGKTGAELKEATYKVINPHTTISGYSDLPKYFERTDVYPDSRRWWDMYSDIPLYAPSFKGLNREHSFPKSWWGGSQSTPAYVDLNHLYPSEVAANTAKSNYPLGVVLTAKFDNGVSKVGYPVSGQGGGASQVFEPDDKYKGDFARTYFYMATCYVNLTWKYTYMVQNNAYPTLTPWALDMLLQWSRQDPVSQKEIDRNEVIYTIQNNRNPFIDFPQLAEYIWGNHKGEAFSVTGQGQVTPPAPGEEPEIITPKNGMSLDFPDVAIGNKSTAKLFFNTQHFTKDINVTLSGENRSLFTPDSKRISYSLSNGEEGYWLTITYEPKEIGEHVANLVVYGDEIVGSFTVKLRGECFPVPQLNAPEALPAANIEEDTYLASWQEPEGETPVDYYVVTLKRVKGQEEIIEEMVAEDESLEIDGFAEADHDVYSVQAVRLGYRSPASNEITVSHTGINDVKVDSPLSLRIENGTITFLCNAPQSGLRIYDLTGRLVKSLPQVINLMEIEMPTGAYVITTDAHFTPVKVLIK